MKSAENSAPMPCSSLQEFAKTHNCGGVHTQCTVQDGDVTALILEVAEDRAVDLIVMGTHGLRGIDHLTLGSVTEKVLRKAGFPVLTVRKPAHHLPPRRECPNLSRYSEYSAARIFRNLQIKLWTTPSPWRRSTAPNSLCFT